MSASPQKSSPVPERFIEMENHASGKGFIRHVVFFSSKDPDDINRISTGLSMLAEIPSVRHFEVGTNLNKDRFGNDVDVVVYAEFESEDAMQAYRNHPIYEECIRIVRPLREMRVAADFRTAQVPVPTMAKADT